jgi:hypothetical protein
VTLRLTVSQSVSKFWYRAPSGAHDQIFISVWQLRSSLCSIFCISHCHNKFDDSMNEKCWLIEERQCWMVYLRENIFFPKTGGSPDGNHRNCQFLNTTCMASHCIKWGLSSSTAIIMNDSSPVTTLFSWRFVPVGLQFCFWNCLWLAVYRGPIKPASMFQPCLREDSHPRIWE